VPESDLYNLGGQVSGREAGSYTAYATLVDRDNYEWVSGEAGSVAIEWRIDKATVSQTDSGASAASGSAASPKVTSTAKPAVDSVFTAGGVKLRYRVTATGATPTVCLTGMKTAAKSLKVPATVTHDGVKYKVTALGNKAFKASKKLANVVIGSNVKTIGAQAFKSCKKLKSLTLGKGVSRIGANAFAACPKLKTVVIKSKKLTLAQTGKKAFSALSKQATVKVPASKRSAYKKLLVKRGLPKKAKVKS